ncbi:MAG: PP2C family protein-serine/threonine phosphatase [Gammaproteobacteria bacterium]
MSRQSNPHEITCMEIWGGNARAKRAIGITGFDVWVSSNPYQNMPDGGDIYYISSCGAGKISRFSLADISGHGTSASYFAKCLRKLMRKYINTTDQTRFAQKLNDDFSVFARKGMFATALLTAYDAETDKLKICNAGHPKPLLYRKQNNTWWILDEALEDCSGQVINIPLGINGETNYLQYEISLMPGDIMVMYTDAAMEVLDKTGSPLGETGLLALVEDIPKDDPQHFGEALHARLFYKQSPGDDVTLIVLFHNASNPPRQNLYQRLQSVWRMVVTQD